MTRSLPEQDSGRAWEERRPFTMAHVVQPLDQPSNYKDSQSRVDRQKQVDLLAKSSTLYVRFLQAMSRILLSIFIRLVT